MMTSLATVTSVIETNTGNLVSLSCEQQTSCSHCQSQKSCGTGIVSKAIGNKSHEWTLTTSQPVKVGEVVEIGLPEKNVIQFASLVYLVPLAMLMIGAVIGQFFISPMLGGGEGWTILTSALFMGLGAWFARIISVQLQSKSEDSVTLLRVLGDTLDIVEAK